MERRNFLQKTTVAAALAGIGSIGYASQTSMESKLSNSAKFKLKYAPAFNAFPELAGNDFIDVIRFCKDQGFSAMFDDGLFRSRSFADQEKIAGEMARLGMDFGPFCLYSDFNLEYLVLNDKSVRELLIKKAYEGVEFCKRTGAKMGMIGSGRYNQRMAWDLQTANVIDHLRAVCDVAEKGGLIISLEPLNKRDHPGQFLSGMPQAYAICRAVNSPSCKIVDDLYHQQITEGNLIPNIDACWPEITAFHIGDNPGRNEPGTGEINFTNIFKHIYDKGYNGVLCIEHGKGIKGKEGEQALIDAYRKADNF